MNNIKFNYLYRDAGNYKKWADIIFSNPDRLTLGAITKALQGSFLADGLFIADQIRIPEVFLSTEQGFTDDDHCFHEFDAVEPSPEISNDKFCRTIREFIAEVKREADLGWRTFDPHDRFLRMRGPA